MIGAGQPHHKAAREKGAAAPRGALHSTCLGGALIVTSTAVRNPPNFPNRPVSAQADDKSPHPAPSDAELVRAALGGEANAFDDLVRRYQRQATAVSYRLLNHREDAMEVVQEAFLKAFDRLKSLQKPGRFGPWLLRIVNNLSLNRRRSRALRRTASLEAMTAGDGEHSYDRPEPTHVAPDAAASAEDIRRLIQRHLEDLPEMQRQALVLFSIEQMPQKRVAEILGCSVEAVKWHVFTARKKLKEKLKDVL